MLLVFVFRKNTERDCLKVESVLCSTGCCLAAHVTWRDHCPRKNRPNLTSEEAHVQLSSVLLPGRVSSSSYLVKFCNVTEDPSKTWLSWVYPIPQAVAHLRQFRPRTSWREQLAGKGLVQYRANHFGHGRLYSNVSYLHFTEKTIL